MRWFLATGLMLVQASTGLSELYIDFEAAEGYFNGCPIEQKARWQSIPEGIGLVTQETSFNGGQSLKIESHRSRQLGEPGLELTYQPDGLPQTGVRFIELGIKPASANLAEFSEYQNGKTLLHLWGASLAFSSGTDGNVQIVAAGADGRNVDPILIQANESGESNRWLHLVIRQDLDAETWDLFVDGVSKATDLTLLPGEDQDRLAIFSNEIGATYIDGIGIGRDNPLSLDEEANDWTDTHRASDQVGPKRNDQKVGRNHGKEEALKDLAASSNTSTIADPQASDATPRTLYVDNGIGSDANSGKFPHPSRRDGPKASIKAAMAVAPDGAVIVVLPGKGIYEEGSRSANGKKLTIRTVKPIIIK